MWVFSMAGTIMAGGVIVGAASMAMAANVPQSLGGTWTCNYDTGDKSTITAVAGETSIKYQYNSGRIYEDEVEASADGGIQSSGNGWAWTMTPSDSGAQFVFTSTKKNKTLTALCTRS
jgi:hypothetical protein